MEVVTERELPLRKAWTTIGEPRLLVVGHYRMGFEIAPRGGESLLRVFIDYSLPADGFGRILGEVFGSYYAKWCTRRMLADAIGHFASRDGQSNSRAA